MAKVVAINISEKKGVIKKPVEMGKFVVGYGISEDAHGGDWHRQVSLLAQESIDKMIEKGGMDLSPGVFAENVTTQGIALYNLPIGTKLRIGDVLLEVTQIGKECHRGCEIMKKVGDCVMPREGIFAVVLEGGDVFPEEEIEILGC